MPPKDFYKILDIPVSASQAEVKKAYRKLALKYHPDVNAGGKATENWFRQINEAYQTLGDPDRRSAYDQHRWYRESTISGRTDPPQTPEELLNRSRALAMHTMLVGEHQTNYAALQQYLLNLLNDENLAMLSQWNKTDIDNQIANELINASAALGYQRFLPVANRLNDLLKNKLPMLEQALKQKRRSSYWKNYQPLYVLGVTVLLCLLIYLLSK